MQIERGDFGAVRAVENPECTRTRTSTVTWYYVQLRDESILSADSNLYERMSVHHTKLETTLKIFIPQPYNRAIQLPRWVSSKDAICFF